MGALEKDLNFNREAGQTIQTVFFKKNGSECPSCFYVYGASEQHVSSQFS